MPAKGVERIGCPLTAARAQAMDGVTIHRHIAFRDEST